MASESEYRVAAQQEMRVQRVTASMHSSLYSNAFSSVGSEDMVVSSVPAANRMLPGACCGCGRCCCCFACEACCDPMLPENVFLDPSLRDILEVDASEMTVLVSCGFTLREVHDVLCANGLVLRGTPEADTITIGGAIAAGAHGGGRWQQPLSGSLLALWLRDAGGQLRHVPREHADFGAAAVSLGLLGVIVRVKLRCAKPETNFKVTGSMVRPYGKQGLLTATAETHSFQFAPYIQRMVRFDEEQTEDSPNCCFCLEAFTRRLVSVPPIARGVDAALSCCPFLAYILSQALVCPGMRVYDRFKPYIATPANYAYAVEYAFNVEQACVVFEELQAALEECAERGLYVSYRFWCRYLGAVDRSWALAQSAGGDKVAFEIVLSQLQRGVDELLDVVVAVFRKHKGRPHLGKTIRSNDVAYAAKVYGGAFGGAPFQAFEAVRRRYDPEGVFLNETLRAFVEIAAREANAAHRDNE